MAIKISSGVICKDLLMRGNKYEYVLFVLWMLGYPLVCSIGSYLSYLSGKRYSVQVTELHH